MSTKNKNLRKARNAGRVTSALGLAFLGAAGSSWFAIRQQLLSEGMGLMQEQVTTDLASRWLAWKDCHHA